MENVEETPPARGVDRAIVLTDKVYVIEFKVDGKEVKTLSQIKQKGYL